MMISYIDLPTHHVMGAITKTLIYALSKKENQYTAIKLFSRMMQSLRFADTCAGANQNTTLIYTEFFNAREWTFFCSLHSVACLYGAWAISKFATTFAFDPIDWLSLHGFLVYTEGDIFLIFRASSRGNLEIWNIFPFRGRDPWSTSWRQPLELSPILYADYLPVGDQ